MLCRSGGLRPYLIWLLQGRGDHTSPARRFANRIDCVTRSDLQPETVTCPACGTALPAADVKAPVVECPNCHEEFFAVSSAEPEAEASPESAPADLPDAEAELSANRIRQIAALRRGAYRSRSYCIVAIFVRWWPASNSRHGLWQTFGNTMFRRQRRICWGSRWRRWWRNTFSGQLAS